MKVGDYVRLDRCQGINKIDEEDEIGTFYLEDVIGDEWGDETFRLDTNDVIKSSPNILDLIEVGDIIRGKDNHLFEVYAVGSDCVYIYNLKEFILIKDIKDIVTKEQFSQMEYRIGK